MKKSVLLFSTALLFITKSFAQDASNAATGAAPEASVSALKLNFPKQPGWNVLQEGQKLEFGVSASGGTGNRFTYMVTQGKVEGLEFDSLGRFSWTPSYEFVERLAESRTVQVLFEARNEMGESVSQVVEFKVEHVNRPPVVDELRPMYIRAGKENTYTIEPTAVKDEDGDPIVFVPILDALPQGAKLSPQGEFTWKPSTTLFRQVANKPIEVEFFVEDQPSKARTKGRFRIEITKQDMRPSIQLTPSKKVFRYNEDASINLTFHLSDENGETDLASFTFVADQPGIPPTALVKNTPSQYEFIWKPGYDFVKDPLDSLSVNLTFAVIDKAHLKDEREITLTIINTENVVEKDMKLYAEYRSSLVRAWDLMEQLKEAEKDLKKKYNRAKKGKKGRSITNAGLGAMTGITPVVVDLPATSKKITTIGGTTVMTIGTLEATEVIGRSTKDLVERLNYIMEKRNELQTKGDIFARKYALKSSRRRSEFLQDVDQFVAVMNLKGLVALELDAGWKNKSKASNENIAKTFKDFNGEN